MIKSLEVILHKWNVETNEKDGYFFEFTHRPEHRIFKNSEAVVADLPTIQVNFNLTADGSSGSLIIGEGDLKYMYKFEERSDVKKFHDLLENGLQELDSMTD